MVDAVDQGPHRSAISSLFRDIPAQLYTEQFATPDEKAIINNTYLIVDRSPSKLGRSKDDAQGMCVHIKDGYFFSALHCFQFKSMAEGSSHQVTLKSSDGTEKTTTMNVVTSGAPFFTDYEGQKDGIDWVIFSVDPSEMSLINLPEDVYTTFPTEEREKSISIVGMPGHIQIQANGAQAFQNEGEQIAVRTVDAARIERRILNNPRNSEELFEMKKNFKPEILWANIQATSGYSGGPMIVDHKYLGGIAYKAGFEEPITVGMYIEHLLDKLARKMGNSL